MNTFKWIVGLSALIIAGCAAYFSVTGIALLFSGSLLGVGIMASSLELGKLVTASYLHRNWKNISTSFKIYFVTAVLVLIFITSLGIFGYLSNAYQKTAVDLSAVESRVELVEQKRDAILEDVDRFNDRIDILANQRTAQETRYDSLVAGENWVNARRTYELITSADEEIKSLNDEVSSRRDEVRVLNEEIYEINQSAMNLSKDIGGFKFIAEAFNIPIEKVVKWFIIIIIFVFDPLAVSLVVAFNALDTQSKKTDETKDEYNTKKFNKQIIDKPVEKTTEQVSDKTKTEVEKEEKDEYDTIMDNLGKVSSSSQNIPNEKKTRQ